MQRLYENYSSIEQMTDRLLQSDNKKTKHSSESDLSFREILSSTQEKSTSSAVTGLKFSKHANARLATRNINLSDQQMERLENGTTKAREKGIQESLIMCCISASWRARKVISSSYCFIRLSILAVNCEFIR